MASRLSTITAGNITGTSDMGRQAHPRAGGEGELDLQHLSCLQCAGQTHEHQMQAAGCQFNHAASRNFDPIRQGPHLHHAVFMHHGVDLGLRGEIRSDTDKPVSLVRMVMDRHITTGRGHAGGRGADLHITCLQALHGTGCGRASRQKAKEKPDSNGYGCFDDHDGTLCMSRISYCPASPTLRKDRQCSVCQAAP